MTIGWGEVDYCHQCEGAGSVLGVPCTLCDGRGTVGSGAGWQSSWDKRRDVSGHHLGLEPLPVVDETNGTW